MGPGDEHENGQVAVRRDHMNSGNRAELKPQDSQEFPTLQSLDSISGCSGDRMVGTLTLQC